MLACPACAAPLDPEGICSACGALSRGFFRGLELGRPQVAQAVARGLDFYQLLELPVDADIRTIARRYRRLRAVFPDNPARLAPEPVRKLELLELAGRVLTDPALRQSYDALRSQQQATAQTMVVRCRSCAAPLEPDASHCRYCNTPAPVTPAPPANLPDDLPPVELTDYYVLLGLDCDHLHAAPEPAQYYASRSLNNLDAIAALATQQPPDEAQVDLAAFNRQQALLLQPGLTPEEREQRYQQLEIGRRILRNAARRPQYDAILQALTSGRLNRTSLEALHALEELALAEYHSDQGDGDQQNSASLLRQAEGFLDAGLPQDALLLVRPLVIQPDAPSAAHRLFVQAILALHDPLSLSGFLLRQFRTSLAAVPDSAALLALCDGVQAREDGRALVATQSFQYAISLDSQLSPAWRGLAILALERGDLQTTIDNARRALQADRQDERSLLLIIAACARANHLDQAYEAAGQVARLRGDGWDAARVMREVA